MKRSILLAAALIFTGAPETPPATNEISGYEYTVIDGEVTVVGFTGEPVYIDIPGFIEGCPVTEIRDNAFYNCHSLKSIKLPDTVLKIGHHSFYACYELESVILPDGLEEIGMGCFCGCGELSYVELPDTLKVLPDSCFRACASLTAVTLPQELETIEKLCFSGCRELRSVETGDSLADIGERAFYMCGGLGYVYIPPSVKNIGTEALGYDCDGNMLIKHTEMIIAGAEGSAAERYAEENGMVFAEGDRSVGAFAEIGINDDPSGIPAAAWWGLAVFAATGAAVLWWVFGGSGEGSLNDDEKD